MKRHIPDMQADLSHLSREELEQWYNNMAYTVGLLVFQFGTELNVTIPENKLIEYGSLGMRRLWFSTEENGTRIIELRKAEGN